MLRSNLEANVVFRNRFLYIENLHINTSNVKCERTLYNYFFGKHWNSQNVQLNRKKSLVV